MFIISCSKLYIGYLAWSGEEKGCCLETSLFNLLSCAKCGLMTFVLLISLVIHSGCIKLCMWSRAEIQFIGVNKVIYLGVVCSKYPGIFHGLHKLSWPFQVLVV